MNRSDDSPNDNDFMDHNDKKKKILEKAWADLLRKSFKFKDQFGSLPQQRKLPVREAVRCGSVTKALTHCPLQAVGYSLYIVPICRARRPG